MNMIGVNIFGVTQNRIAAAQSLKRQTVGSIDSGRTQDRHANAAPRTELPQTGFGVHPAERTVGARRTTRDLTDARAVTIAVHARRTYVHQALW
jgi:hypothetical protein